MYDSKQYINICLLRVQPNTALKKSYTLIYNDIMIIDIRPSNLHTVIAILYYYYREISLCLLFGSTLVAIVVVLLRLSFVAIDFFYKSTTCEESSLLAAMYLYFSLSEIKRYLQMLKL